MATQHDTCPVCRKSLNGEDSSSQPPSESPSLSMDPRTQERWSFWDTHPSHFSVLLAYIQQRTRRRNTSLFISVAAIIISVWFSFLNFNAFLFNHVYRYPNRRLNCHLRWLDLFFLLLLLFCLITNQLRLIIIKPMSSLLTPKPPFPSSFKCTVENTQLWGNARSCPPCSSKKSELNWTLILQLSPIWHL